MAEDQKIKEKCSDCSVRELCFPMEITDADMTQLDVLVKTKIKVRKKEYLYRQGDEFNSIYAVRVGFLKTAITNSQGEEKILGFNMSGELLGLDGFANNKYESSVVALHDSEICVIEKNRIDEISQTFHPLQNCLQKILSTEIVRNNNLSISMSSMNAEQKISTFLLNLGQRFKMRNQSENHFILRMTRSEIGSYVDLTIETVSRTLRKLESMGVIKIHSKLIKIIDINKLKENLISCQT
ncbi:MAG: helix-turn-helix domain-containing protein [Nitrosomonadales bacterium]|nr:helix-turn-helix domain-containing protein [Nitrosomonadales bacterium]MBT3918189.1 helix-turn-helix domain-containing protein [Nitrosomonadales bacterium]MBT4182865.1 helix-turn-helix domain-containing protein [Nitrosomonadales bacterium]MBT4571424.1 helix-turn-helix domain-containing protein [Nitrosomonadales bacterium]MBT6014788.1 helix-turn-helix domain-containing protein [Nitrosomonadales bacterium]